MQKFLTCSLVGLILAVSGCSNYDVTRTINILKPTPPELPKVVLVEPQNKEVKIVACLDDPNARNLLERDVKLQGYINQLEIIVSKCIEE